MSTTVSFVGGLPDGFGIFGSFFVSVPIAPAIFVTAAVGFAKVGCAVVVVVDVVVDVVVVALASPEPLGMSAFFVPPPHAASPRHAAASTGHLREVVSRFTARHLTRRSCASNRRKSSRRRS
jgi:hypothetical protein